MRTAAIAALLLGLAAAGLRIVGLTPPAYAHYDGPPGPDAAWWASAMTPDDCLICCDVSDGHVVQARPDPASPLGWDVFWDDTWIVVPAGTRAAICKPDDGREGDHPDRRYHRVDDYPPHPAGSAVVWIWPVGSHKIRCFDPPDAGG